MNVRRVPDPDSIARPRTLKDARFNKDPYSEQKKAALKREARLRGLNGYGSGSGSATSSVDASSIDGAAATRMAAAGWPVQKPRSFLPQSAAVRSASAKPDTVVSATASPSTKADSDTHLQAPGLTRRGDPPTSATVASRKSTSGAYQPGAVLDHKTETPVVTKTSVPKTNGAHFLARHDTPTPAWAGPLEKLLAEAPSVGPALSLPPHLRKPISAKSNPMLNLDQNYKAANEASRRVLGKSNVQVSSDNKDTINDGALALKMATTDMGIKDSGEVSAVASYKLYAYANSNRV